MFTRCSLLVSSLPLPTPERSRSLCPQLLVRETMPVVGRRKRLSDRPKQLATSSIALANVRFVLCLSSKIASTISGASSVSRSTRVHVRSSQYPRAPPSWAICGELTRSSIPLPAERAGQRLDQRAVRYLYNPLTPILFKTCALVGHGRRKGLSASPSARRVSRYERNMERHGFGGSAVCRGSFSRSHVSSQHLARETAEAHPYGSRTLSPSVPMSTRSTSRATIARLFSGGKPRPTAGRAAEALSVRRPSVISSSCVRATLNVPATISGWRKTARKLVDHRRLDIRPQPNVRRDTIQHRASAPVWLT